MSVSIREVAQRAGVSVGTVSNVLNRPDAVSDATVERVRAAIDELGYVRNDAARQLRAGRSSTVGLVVLDAGNPFFTEVARGAEDAAADRDVAVLLGNSDERTDREDAYLSLFEEQRVRGVLLSPVSEALATAQRLRDHGTPVVLVDRTAPGSDFSSVAVDDVRGGYIAAAHLLGQGRRRIAFVGGGSLRQVEDRFAGAQRAVAEVPGATIERVATDQLTVIAGREAGSVLVERAERPDAIFAANDLLAVGVMQALVMIADLKIPDDIALIGYDDIAFAASTVVPLSSIRQPARLIGSRALEVLEALIDDPARAPETIEFEPELVVRASTAG
ncbi:LacI family transcriptional regulator [Microbacterium sorbitolivorans]|uniref:LacI family transcriptional regulator n=1 Tax=Microbacterium sorbitolivorans TaxID=1867410 RepID=A0A367Y1Y1_9MICO|nr:LacI family DNA-binding transcriptional regulator [Microbacterium sorbitolivorans]RCK59837.1 LacI family transcriptional regulator [Microbacterium sorbitolivorans]GGF40424.1 LacI family transcriptional regulator [Microbacterium sorbitolivorans]